MVRIQVWRVIFARLSMNKIRFVPSRAQTPSSALVFALLVLALRASLAAGQQVKLIATPDDGIQPQAAVDSKGVVHLIYFKGDPKGGDIFYVRRAPGQDQFSKLMPVNTQPHTAMALGTIRGAQLAVGKNGRVHVAWDGMGAGSSLDSHASHGHDASGHPPPSHEGSEGKSP